MHVRSPGRPTVSAAGVLNKALGSLLFCLEVDVPPRHASSAITMCTASKLLGLLVLLRAGAERQLGVQLQEVHRPGLHGVPHLARSRARHLEALEGRHAALPPCSASPVVVGVQGAFRVGSSSGGLQPWELMGTVHSHCIGRSQRPVLQAALAELRQLVNSLCAKHDQAGQEPG